MSRLHTRFSSRMHNLLHGKPVTRCRLNMVPCPDGPPKSCFAVLNKIPWLKEIRHRHGIDKEKMPRGGSCFAACLSLPMINVPTFSKKESCTSLHGLLVNRVSPATLLPVKAGNRSGGDEVCGCDVETRGRYNSE